MIYKLTDKLDRTKTEANSIDYKDQLERFVVRYEQEFQFGLRDSWVADEEPEEAASTTTRQFARMNGEIRRNDSDSRLLLRSSRDVQQ